MDGRELVQELKSRHIASTAPTSRALVATIDALSETLEAAGNVNDLLAYVGACVSSLDSVSSADDAPVISAVCTLLATLLPHVSQQQTRSIFLKTSPVICKITSLLHEAADVAGVKWAAHVLAQLLCCPDTEATWAPVKAPLLMLVRIAMHSNAKARKVAQEGLSNVFTAYQGASHRQASEEIEQVAKVVLAAPHLAAKQAASATKSQREDAEEAIVQSVQDSLYFMGALKMLMPHLTGTASLRVCEFVLDTFVLAQPILTMHGVDCLIRALQGFSQQGVPPSRTQQLLAAVLPMLDTQKPASVLLSLIRFVEDSLRELHQESLHACEQSLPSAIVKLVEMLGAETEDVRFAASSAVSTVFQCCVSQQLVHKCASDSGASSRRENVLKHCMVAMVAMLGVGYRDSWPHVLRCLADIFTVLGPAGATLTVPVLEVLLNMARGHEEGGEHVALANTAIGACISSIGPEVVLQVAPIDLQHLANLNTWILPLLRKHTRCTQMALWGEYFLPRARAVGSVAIKARDSGKPGDHLKLSALELQMWNLLESFSRWAHDVPQALESFGEVLGVAFHSRMDLEVPICSALKQLCAQTSAALHNAGEADGAGFGLAVDEEVGAGVDTASVVVPHMFEDTVPTHFDIDVAKAHRDVLRGIAQKWLQELLNRFVQLNPAKRTPVAETISAMAMVAGEAVTATFYKEALSKVVSSLQAIKAGTVVGDPEADVCTFLEVGLLLVGGISDASTLPLFKAAQLTLAIKKPAPQKKAYKVLSYLFVRRPAMLERCKQDAVAILLETSSADVAAKRFRLRCMQPVILLLSSEGESAWCSPSDQPAQAAKLIAELVLGIKEVNAKTRTEAYRVLAATAHALHEADPPVHSSDASAAHSSGDAAATMKLDGGSLQRMFACTLAGVASQSPRMTSASVMALARLLFEFAGELQLPAAMLLPSLCALLRSKAREIIKSVLGFLKVAAVRLPAEILQQHLPTIIEGLLIWAQDSKNKFKMKVRRLLERLCKRCGYEAVAAAWPNADPKLLSSIRKGLARSTREKNARKNASHEGESEAGDSEVSAGRKTVSGSEWRHTQIFSDEGEDGGAGEDGDARSRAGQSLAHSSASRSKGRAGPARKAASTGQLANEGSNPMNLLDSSASAALMRSAAGKWHAPEEPQGASEFERNAAGQFVFKEEKENGGKKHGDDDPLSTKWRKRRRPDTAAEESDDSEFEDMRGVAGLPAVLKGTQGAQSLKGASKYASGASMKSKASRASDPGQLSGAKYKAKKASGDNQGGNRVEPFAYWRFDKNMLNTRANKNQRAKSQLGSMVKTGVVRGNKAKKSRKSA